MGPGILIVEDEADLAYALRQTLQACGYRCHTALNGLEALNALQAAAPAAVLLDLSLPGVSGLEFLQRARTRWPQTKVLVVTGHSHDYSHLASQFGVAGILQKPVTLETLLASLTRLVPLAA